MLTNAIVQAAKGATFIVEKNAPKILAATAAGASVAACATTAYATWKSKDILEENNACVARLKEYRDTLTDEEDIEFCNKAIRERNLLTAAELACNYTVPTILLGGSVAAGIGATSILSSRIAALGASYAALSSAFNEYRNRVRNSIGENEEENLYSGMEYVEEELIDDKGKKTKTKKLKYTSPPLGEFSVFWIVGENKYSQGDSQLDINFIHNVEDRLTRELYYNIPHISLENILACVGFDAPSKYLGKMWHMAGKIKSADKINEVYARCEREGLIPTDEMLINANKISFGITEEQEKAFISGETDGVLLLKPNVDGDIYTNGAFHTLRDDDVYVPAEWYGMRPYDID